jgi:hypothetical protein
MITALVLIFIGTILAILMIVGAAPGAAGIIGFVLALLSLVFETAGWAHFRQDFGTDGNSYEYGFALAM